MLRVLKSCASAPRFFTTSPLPTISPFAPRLFSGAGSSFIQTKLELMPDGMPDPPNMFDAHVYSKDTPGIVLLSDSLGIDEQAKLHALKASQLANGCSVIIPDLQGNYDSADKVCAVHSSIQLLKSKGSNKFGVIGFSKGAALAFQSSYSHPPIDVVIAFYGTPSCIRGIPQCPLQVHFGDDDDRVGFSDKKVVKALRKFRKMSKCERETWTYKGSAS